VQKNISKHTFGVLGIVAASLIWGTIPLVLREIDGSAFIKVFFRVFFSFVVIGVWLLASGRWRKIGTLDARLVRRLLAQGALLGFNWMLFLGAFERTDVATVELLGYMGPVLVAILAPMLLKEKFDKRIVIPLTFSLAGMLIILVPHGLGFSSDATARIGAGMAACSAVTYALLVAMGKKLTTLAPIDILTWFEGLGASLLLLPFALWGYGRGGGPTGGLAPYLYLFVLGAIHTQLASLLFFVGLKRLRADQAVVFTYVEPVSAVIFAAIFLGQPLTLFTVVGGLLVVAGGTIVARFGAQSGIETTPIEVAPTPEGR
jgi:drug/metabolite transporter (DMT)-like permease